MAVQAGHVGVVALLKEEGADINQRRSNLWTPLQIASENGYLKIVNLLLKWKAKLNVVNEMGITAVFSASLKNHTKIVRSLIDAGADVALPLTKNGGASCLHAAALTGNRRYHSIFVTPRACETYKNCRLVRLLLAKGSNPARVMDNGYTALHLAAESNHPEIVQVLLERKGSSALSILLG